MPPRKWDLRIRDILTSIERTIEYTRKMDFEQFRSDTKTVDALSHLVPQLKSLLEKHGA